MSTPQDTIVADAIQQFYTDLGQLTNTDDLEAEFVKLIKTIRQNAPRETRLAAVFAKPFHEWTLTEVLLLHDYPPYQLSLPAPSRREFPLNLLHVPGEVGGETGYPFEKRFWSIFTHSACALGNYTGLEKCDQVIAHKLPGLFVLEKVLDPSKPLTHAMFTEFTLGPAPLLGVKVKSITITFGRKNGPSNMAELQIGSSFVSCPEKLFQASKAMSVGNTAKALEIFGCDDGLGALMTAHHKNFQMSQEQISQWDNISFRKLLEAKLCCLADPVFNGWLVALHQFTEDNHIDDILFLEVGSQNELKYTCGLMGDVIQERLRDGKYDQLYKDFGPGQVTTNISGVILSKVFQVFREGYRMGFYRWDQIVGVDSMFA